MLSAVNKPIIFLSGMHPGPSGTGEWLRYILSQGGEVISGRHLDEPRATIRARDGILAEWRQNRTATTEHRRFIESLPDLAKREDCEFVLVHPQSMGLRQALAFMQARKSITHFFLLDNSFFCIRSYNHLRGEHSPCLACMGGAFESIARHHCEPFPKSDSREAIEFVQKLQVLVREGRVRFMAQSASHAALAASHFGCEVPVVGLWANGWDECLNAPAPRASSTRWDIVFHGWNVPAKGADWMIEVAQRCPDLTFLMPFYMAQRKSKLLSNCTFEGKSWGSGLREAIRDAHITAVPSLWSASVEGALFKSIAFAPAVAVVENDTAFSSELPDGLVLRLPADPNRAALALREAVAARWTPDAALRTHWLDDFTRFNRSMYQRLIASVRTSAP